MHHYYLKDQALYFVSARYGPWEVFALWVNLFGVSKAFLLINIVSQERSSTAHLRISEWIKYILALTYYGINWHIVTCIIVYIIMFSPTWQINVFAWILILIICICCSAVVHVTWCQMLRYNAKYYRHSFCRPEKWIFIITNLNILYIILFSTKFWTCVYKIRQYWANYRLRCVARNARANVKMSCPLLRKTPYPYGKKAIYPTRMSKIPDNFR